ncbi:MAG: protein phosphatase 2C domain-containing protein [Actinomycetota bacterium]|nr:protein phosphatase 2C domain-containing protein [Actinomycetota bacterium]
MTLALRYAARSDRGLIRAKNDDSVYAGPRLLAVADGMGGYAGGDVASKVVIAALEHLDEEFPTGDLLAALARATNDGSEHLRELVRDDVALEGMGTTLTALLFAGSRIALCHIGDSRGYLLRDGVLTQITHDDTFVQAMIDEGRITEEEARSHPQRNLILRALNGNEVEPDLSIREARAGDRYLLCSDGLSGVVSDETIHEALQIPDPQEAANRLIELALRGGGPDNITCVVADVIDESRDGDTAMIDPVVDGAAGDNVGQRDIDPMSSAGRAALAAPEKPTVRVAARAAAPPPRRRRTRLLLGALAAVVLLAAAAGGVWAYVMSQYFVGVVGTDADNQHVAIFRGVNAELIGLDFYRLQEETALAVADLNSAARSSVRDGIPADDLNAAQNILENLRDARLPLCAPTPTTPEATTPPLGTTESPVALPTARPSQADPSSSTAPGPTARSQTGANCREGG